MRLRRSARSGAVLGERDDDRRFDLAWRHGLFLQPVGAGENLDRMIGAEGFGSLLALGHFHHLHQVLGRQRAFRRDVAGIVLQRGLCRGLADLHRHVEVLGPRAPDAAMAAAPFNHRDPRLGDEAQHLRALRAHVLRPRMAGEMQADTALDRGKALGQPVLPGDVDDVLGEIEGRPGKPLDGGIPGQDQRPFELQHQRAGRRQRHDVVALVDPRQQRVGNHAGRGGDRVEITRSSLGMPQQAGWTTSVWTPFMANTPRAPRQ